MTSRNDTENVSLILSSPLNYCFFFKSVKNIDIYGKFANRRINISLQLVKTRFSPFSHTDLRSDPS